MKDDYRRGALAPLSEAHCLTGVFARRRVARLAWRGARSAERGDVVVRGGGGRRDGGLDRRHCAREAVEG